MLVTSPSIFGPIQFRLDSFETGRKLKWIDPSVNEASLVLTLTWQSRIMNAESLAELYPANWDPALDAVIAAPKHHKVLFENGRLRVLEITLKPNDKEPVHHHRWPSVFVFDQVQGPVHDIAPDGMQLPPNRDVIKAIEAWKGQGCLVVNMAPQPAGRVFNASGKTIHGIRVEMKQ
jgi:hypothetical protein